jgi:hypothetical protein
VIGGEGGDFVWAIAGEMRTLDDHSIHRFSGGRRRIGNLFSHGIRHSDCDVYETNLEAFL